MRIKNIIYHTFYTLCIIALTSCSSDKPTYLEPHLSTLPATDITRTEATLHGSVMVEGDTDVPQLSFHYGTQEYMEISTPVEKVDDGSNGSNGNVGSNGNNGNVSLKVSNLRAGTTYYYMLQGSNGRTITTSNLMSFTTAPNDKPTLGEASILSQGPMSVIVGYEITDDGGEDIIETGCYIALGDGEKKKILGEGILGEGILGESNLAAGQVRNLPSQCKLRIGDLQRNASYQIWPFATNREGENIGNAIAFNTTDAVKLEKAGEMNTLMGDNLFDYTALTLSGPMNGDDLNCLRRMMGRNIDGSTTAGKLSDIDLSEVKIVAGGGSYGSGRYTQDGVIGQGLFAQCTGLTQVILPSNATEIEQNAFMDCTSLKRIEIPASITTLLPSSGCTALEDIEVSKANTHYQSQDGVLLNADTTQILWFPMGKKGSYNLPATIQRIGDYAFRECSIEPFTLPDGLKEIGQGAFMDSQVREVKLPDNLRTVPTGTFQGCTQLRVVRLGSKAEQICAYAFDRCPLTDLYITSVYPPACQENALSTKGEDFLKTCTLHVPAGKKQIYRNHKVWGQFTHISEE